MAAAPICRAASPAPNVEEGRLHPVAGAPGFCRRVCVVENASTVRAWP